MVFKFNQHVVSIFLMKNKFVDHVCGPDIYFETKKNTSIKKIKFDNDLVSKSTSLYILTGIVMKMHFI